MTDQYNKGKDFDYNKPKTESPEYTKLLKDFEEAKKRISNCEGRLVAAINDNRTTRKNMMAMQEHMKTMNQNLNRATNEIRQLKELVDALLREDKGY